jgi:hypothetical protein
MTVRYNLQMTKERTMKPSSLYRSVIIPLRFAIRGITIVMVVSMATFAFAFRRVVVRILKFSCFKSKVRLLIPSCSCVRSCVWPSFRVV